MYRNANNYDKQSQGAFSQSHAHVGENIAVSAFCPDFCEIMSKVFVKHSKIKTCGTIWQNAELGHPEIIVCSMFAFLYSIAIFNTHLFPSYLSHSITFWHQFLWSSKLQRQHKEQLHASVTQIIFWGFVMSSEWMTS